MIDCDTLYIQGKIHSPRDSLQLVTAINYGGRIIIHCYQLINTISGVIQSECGYHFGGSILIISEIFINNGVIANKKDKFQSLTNGAIAIYSNNRTNNGVITPKPFIGQYKEGFRIFNIIKTKIIKTNWNPRSTLHL